MEKEEFHILKKIDELGNKIVSLNKELQSRDFQQKAPKTVIEDKNNKITQYEDDIEQLKADLVNLKAIDKGLP